MSPTENQTEFYPLPSETSISIPHPTLTLNHTQDQSFNQQININTRDDDPISLLLNIMFLCCGCFFYPCWCFGFCFLTHPNSSVRLLAKINICLFLLPIILLCVGTIIAIPILIFSLLLGGGAAEEITLESYYPSWYSYIGSVSN